MSFNGSVTLFGAIVITLSLRKTNLDCISFEQKSCQIFSSVILSLRKTNLDCISFEQKSCQIHSIWKGDIMVADIEELDEMDASELHVRRLNTKEVLTSQRSGNFIIPVADGTVKIFGREQRLRTYSSIWERPERRQEQEVLRGESDELFRSTPRQDDSTLDDSETRSDFWSSYGSFHLSSSRWAKSQTLLAERRIISYSAEATLPEQHIRH